MFKAPGSSKLIFWHEVGYLFGQWQVLCARLLLDLVGCHGTVVTTATCTHQLAWEGVVYAPWMRDRADSAKLVSSLICGNAHRLKPRRQSRGLNPLALGTAGSSNDHSLTCGYS